MKPFAVILILCLLAGSCASTGGLIFRKESKVEITSVEELNPIEESEPGGGAITKKEEKTIMGADEFIWIFLIPALQNRNNK